jgi:cephalosporin hydroxylase
MESLNNLNNEWTDKNSTHSYFNTYEELFSSKRSTAKNVLEIGIFWGGSIKLWYGYFPSAIIHGTDILTAEIIKIPEIFNNNRVVLHMITNAYSEVTLQSFKTKFDIIIDDGSHNLEDMVWVVKNYSKILDEKGILVIEDIQDFNWLDILRDATPIELRQYIELYDLRSKKGRYDDVLFVINKNI